MNWSEVTQKVLARGSDLGRLHGYLRTLGFTILAYTQEDAEQAALLWPQTRQFGLPLADRACLALAIRLQVPVLTANRAWSGL